MPDRSKSRKSDPAAGASKRGAPAASRSGQRRSRGTPRSRRLIDTAGPEPGVPVEDVRLTVGVIMGSHGVRGELRMSLVTDDQEHLLDVEQVWLGDDPTPITLNSIRFHGEGALITIPGIDTPEAAKALHGMPVRIAGTDARPLDAGEHFYYQLIGLAASTPGGEALGEVVDIIETGAHDVLVIAPAGSRASRSPANEILIPYHESYVHEVDPDGGTITVVKPVYTDEVDPA